MAELIVEGVAQWELRGEEEEGGKELVVEGERSWVDGGGGREMKWKDAK